MNISFLYTKVLNMLSVMRKNKVSTPYYIVNFSNVELEIKEM